MDILKDGCDTDAEEESKDEVENGNEAEEVRASREGCNAAVAACGCRRSACIARSVWGLGVGGQADGFNPRRPPGTLSSDENRISPLCKAQSWGWIVRHAVCACNGGVNRLERLAFGFWVSPDTDDIKPDEAAGALTGGLFRFLRSGLVVAAAEMLLRYLRS